MPLNEYAPKATGPIWRLSAAGTAVAVAAGLGIMNEPKPPLTVASVMSEIQAFDRLHQSDIRPGLAAGLSAGQSTKCIVAAAGNMVVGYCAQPNSSTEAVFGAGELPGQSAIEVYGVAQSLKTGQTSAAAATAEGTLDHPQDVHYVADYASASALEGVQQFLDALAANANAPLNPDLSEHFQLTRARG